MNATMTPETTTDTSAAEQRIADTQRKAQALEAERINIGDRLRTAAGEIEVIQGEILSKERLFTPADQRELPKLRAKRLELVQMMDDLHRLQPTIEHELRQVAEEVTQAHKTVASVEYNVLATRQAKITASMALALEQFEISLREALREKRDVAQQQVVLCVQRMGMPAPAVAVETLVALYKRDLITVVSGYVVDADYSAVKQDWSTRPMSATGELGARG